MTPSTVVMLVAIGTSGEIRSALQMQDMEHCEKAVARLEPLVAHLRATSPRVSYRCIEGVVPRGGR